MKRTLQCLPPKPFFQDRGIVTVVFIDIYDFGKVVAGLHPCDLVMMLDRVFSLMDKVCQEC